MTATISALGRAINLVRNVQELLDRQDRQTPDIIESIDNLDSLLNLLHGLREEERQIARFESGFRDTGLDDIEEIDAEEEAERLQAYEEERERTLSDYELHLRIRAGF